MEEKIIENLREKWLKITQVKNSERHELQIKLHNKLFKAGDYYYFTFIPGEARINFVSEQIKTLLGYNPKEFTVEMMVKIIHPDDFPYFVNFEAAVVDFKTRLSADKIMNYKTRYNYRIRKKNGDYLPILQQSIDIQAGEEGSTLINLVVHTDISAFKTDNIMQLSFIGLEGEPSYINYQSKTEPIKIKDLFTSREKHILSLVAQNLGTREIAHLLSISPATVRTHRRNINAKAGVSNPLALVTKAIGEGWL